jgi:large subunit ribosomal protein L4
MANSRAGTRAQLGRDNVNHTTKKPWNQKGTGRARSGMSSSPIWRGGGRAFPNSPDENFSHKVNRKAYRAGMCSILSELVRQDRLNVVEEFTDDREKLLTDLKNLVLGEGAELEIDLKGTPNPAKVVKLPFYKRQ